MSVSDTTVIDGGALDEPNRQLVLWIADDLDWNDPAAHWGALGDKLNTYLAFFDSAQARATFEGFDPASTNRVILCDFAIDLPDRAQRDRFGAFAEAVETRGTHLIGRHTAPDGAVREYSVTPS